MDSSPKQFNVQFLPQAFRLTGKHRLGQEDYGGFFKRLVTYIAHLFIGYPSDKLIYAGFYSLTNNCFWVNVNFSTSTSIAATNLIQEFGGPQVVICFWIITTTASYAIASFFAFSAVYSGSNYYTIFRMVPFLKGIIYVVLLLCVMELSSESVISASLLVLTSACLSNQNIYLENLCSGSECDDFNKPQYNCSISYERTEHHLAFGIFKYFRESAFEGSITSRSKLFDMCVSIAGNLVIVWIIVAALRCACTFRNLKIFTVIMSVMLASITMATLLLIFFTYGSSPMRETKPNYLFHYEMWLGVLTFALENDQPIFWVTLGLIVSRNNRSLSFREIHFQIIGILIMRCFWVLMISIKFPLFAYVIHIAYRIPLTKCLPLSGYLVIYGVPALVYNTYISILIYILNFIWSILNIHHLIFYLSINFFDQFPKVFRYRRSIEVIFCGFLLLVSLFLARTDFYEIHYLSRKYVYHYCILLSVFGIATTTAIYGFRRINGDFYHLNSSYYPYEEATKRMFLISFIAFLMLIIATVVSNVKGNSSKPFYIYIVMFCCALPIVVTAITSPRIQSAPHWGPANEKEKAERLKLDLGKIHLNEYKCEHSCLLNSAELKTEVFEEKKQL